MSDSVIVIEGDGNDKAQAAKLASARAAAEAKLASDKAAVEARKAAIAAAEARSPEVVTVVVK